MFVGFVAIALLSGSIVALIRDLAPIALKAELCVAAFIALDYVLHRVFCSYSREREFAADAGAAEITSSEAIISALNLLTDPGTAVGSICPYGERKRRLRMMSSKAHDSNARVTPIR